MRVIETALSVIKLKTPTAKLIENKIITKFKLDKFIFMWFLVSWNNMGSTYPDLSIPEKVFEEFKSDNIIGRINKCVAIAP